MPNHRLFLALASICLPGMHALASDVTETVGPLTVRVQEPRSGFYGQFGAAPIDRPGVPLTVIVGLENRGEDAVTGTVRLRVIDPWHLDPTSPVPFRMAPRERTRLDFTVSAGEGTFNAHYPVHAFVEFDYRGRRQVAHPVLMLEPRFPNPPRPDAVFDWKPVAVPTNGAMGIWRLPVRRSTTRVVAEETGSVHRDVTGYSTGFGTDRETFATSPAVEYSVTFQQREALSMELGMRSPSLRERVEMVLVEYPLRLPKIQPVRLRFAAAGPDSVTFRVRVVPFNSRAGQESAVIFERRGAGSGWQDADVDLSRFAGQDIRLQLESEGGSGSATEHAYWAEPTLISGTPPQPSSPFPPAGTAGSRLLGTVEREGVRYEVRVWPGRRGIMDAAVGFVNGDRKLLFRGFRLRVLGDPLNDARPASELLEAREEASTGHYRVRHRFRSWAGPFDLLSDLWIEQGVLRARFNLENTPPRRPWLDVHLENVATGPWTERATRVYCGVGNVIQDPQAFQLDFGGQLLASSFVGFDFANGVAMVQGVDVPPDQLEVDPQTRTYTLNTPHAQTITFIPSTDVWQAVKAWRDVNGLKAAGGVPKLAGRFVFDLWGGTYGQSAQDLRRAFRYGLTDAAVVWHRWQRWGYDFRLPDVYPPNPEFGSFEEFVGLVRACRDNGVLFAPHDNYIDFYADSEGFTYDNMAFNGDRTPVKAWYNPGRNAQSYCVRADRLQPFLERNLSLIKEGFAPTAYFLDVWGSRRPYDYWTSDGQFIDRVATRSAWREGFARIRTILGDNAPQISEAGHDQLIGWLDGGQVQHARAETPPEPVWRLRVIPVRSTDAERIPWFDAAHHDRFIYHGAGYEGRYASGQDLRAHGTYSDDYIATEVLTGHPAMVIAPFNRDVVRKYWLLHDLMRGLALRRLEGLEFAGQNLHRQQVRWDNGGQVYVNRGPQDWTAAEHVLPQYGFYARVPVDNGQVETAIERRDGVIVEWSKSPAVAYFNARPVVLETTSPDDPRPARMNPQKKMIAFGAATTDGAFRLTRDGNALRLTPLPSSPRFQVRLRWKELPWQLPEPREAEAISENDSVTARVALRQENGELVLDCEPGIFAYRLR